MTHQSNSTGKAFLTLREAADYANCSTVTLRRAVRAKALPHHRYGANEKKAKIFIKASDLHTFIDGCRIGAAV